VTDVDGVKPDVSVLDLVVFEKPQVELRNLVVFESPDVRLDELTHYSTAETPRKGQFREWTESLLGTVVFVLAFTTLIAQATQVPTESMKPTILVGDHFFLDKIAFPGNYPEPLRPLLPHRSVRRGDIIAFKPPASASSDNIPFVKRVIAIGDVDHIARADGDGLRDELEVDLIDRAAFGSVRGSGGRQRKSS